MFPRVLVTKSERPACPHCLSVELLGELEQRELPSGTLEQGGHSTGALGRASGVGSEPHRSDLPLLPGTAALWWENLKALTLKSEIRRAGWVN